MTPALKSIGRTLPRCATVTLWAALAVALLILAPPGHADDAAKQFDIRAQPVSEALMAFGAQSGAIVLASTALTTSKVSSPVSGRLVPAEALKRMLRGTGLGFAANGDGSFVIERVPASIRIPAPIVKSKAQ